MQLKLHFHRIQGSVKNSLTYFDKELTQMTPKPFWTKSIIKSLLYIFHTTNGNMSWTRVSLKLVGSFFKQPPATDSNKD